MRCIKCGMELQGNPKFCSNCGSRLPNGMLNETQWHKLSGGSGKNALRVILKCILCFFIWMAAMIVVAAIGTALKLNQALYSIFVLVLPVVIAVAAVYRKKPSPTPEKGTFPTPPALQASKPTSPAGPISQVRHEGRFTSALPDLKPMFQQDGFTSTDYVVFDIETTGFSPKNDRIIEIAAIHYRYTERIDQFHTFVNPGRSIPSEITDLTGISQDDVDTAPSIQDIREVFMEFIGDYPLVGHNITTFDLPFVRTQFRSEIHNPTHDTLYLAKQVFPGLPSYKLEYLNQVFGLESQGAHRALNDVETTAHLFWACICPKICEKEYRAAINQCGSAITDRTYPGKRKHSPIDQTVMANSKISIKDIVPTDVEASKCGPLYGKSIVFTGELSISRRDAMQMAVDAGAILRSSVSRRTNYLVVGEQTSSLVGDDGMSGKERQAYALNSEGAAKIEILQEEDFFALVKKDGAPV